MHVTKKEISVERVHTSWFRFGKGKTMEPVKIWVIARVSDGGSND